MTEVRKKQPKCSDLHLPCPSSKHCIRSRSEFIVCFFQRKARRNLSKHKHGGCWEHRQQLRGPAWGSALPQLLSCSQHTATGSATPMEIKARKALAFHRNSALVCSFFLGGRKSSNNHETQGKGTAASYQLHSQQFPATAFLKEAVS